MNEFKLTIAPKKITLFVLFWTIISDTLIAELKFPSYIQYFNDIAWIILLYFIFKRNFFEKFKMWHLQSINFSLIIYALACMISSIVNLVNPLLIIWAVRNTARFYIFYIACVLYFQKKDVIVIFDKFFVIQIISFVISLYQYFILGYHMDTLGGIFGHGNGAALNTFQALLFAYYLNGFLKKKQPFYKLVIITITSLIIAALAEEKAFFVYLIIVTFGTVILNKPTLKTIIIIAGLFFSIPIAMNLLASVNESWNLEVLTDVNRSLKYMDQSYGLSRLNPFPQIKSLFFGNSIVKNLFGIGFGASENCDATLIFTSDFYRKYGYLQYFDFTHQKKFIELGLLGFASYLLFFIITIINSLNMIFIKRKKEYQNYTMVVFAAVALISCMFSGALIYNDAYIIYFGLAVSSIYIKDYYCKEG